MASAHTTLSSFLPVIAIRLDRANYSSWRFQVVATVRAHGYDDLILATASPPSHFLPSPSTEQPQQNPAYQAWVRRDQFLMSWLIGSMTEPMIGHVTRCVSARELWYTLEHLFQSQSKARIMQIKLQLHTQKKGDLSIDDYFLKMRGYADSLAAVGEPVSDSDLILQILVGFGSEFDAVVCNLTNRPDTLNLPEVQYALQAHEIRLKNNSVFLPSAHYVQSYAYGRGMTGGRFSDGRGNGGANGCFSADGGRAFGGFIPRGRGAGRGVVCQLYGKSNHVALKCYRRFDVHFAGSNVSPQANFAEVSQAGFDPYASQSYYVDNFDASHAFPSEMAYEAAQEEAYYAAMETDVDGQWYADSGATAHVTNDVAKIQQGTSHVGKDQLVVDPQVAHEEGAGQRSVPT